MKKRLLCVLSLLLCLCACGKTPVGTEDSEPLLPVIAPLSAAEVETAAGFAVGEPQTLADGTVSYFSADGMNSAYISTRQMTAAEFDEMLTGFTDGAQTLTDAPHLGEKARWCEETLSLLVYADGRALDVRVEYASLRPQDSLLAARQIAALTMEKW